MNTKDLEIYRTRIGPSTNSDIELIQLLANSGHSVVRTR